MGDIESTPDTPEVAEAPEISEAPDAPDSPDAPDAPELTREGSFRLGGTVYGWWSLDDPALAAWRYVAPDALGVPEAGHVSLSPDFLALLAAHSADDEVRVLTPWPVYLPEFGWPRDAVTCGCLERNGFADVARQLNGDTLVPSPGPVVDRFFIDAGVLDALAAEATLAADTEVAFNVWATVVGVDHAYFAPAFPDFDAPSSRLRASSSQLRQTGEAHEAYARALDAYFYGGLPVRLADENRAAYLDALEARLGYSYAGPGDEAVTRSISTVNAVILVRSYCCTRVETRGTKIFSSRLERVAESTQAAG
ncbi:MAG: hypothetical protein Q7T71_04120 [Herbiconiux sp.]|nr:hypothetical protein [Herbiconiux sp.]